MNGQSKGTGNIGYTRYKTNKRQRISKGQSKMDNPEKLATQGTEDTRQINVREYRRDNQNGHSRDTGNIGYTRYRTNKHQRIPKAK